MQFPPIVSWGHTPLPTLSAWPFQAPHSAFREEAREMKKARWGDLFLIWMPADSNFQKNPRVPSLSQRGSRE